LHVHKGKTDSIDLSSCCNDLVTGNEHRLQVFGSFKQSIRNLKYNLGRTIKFFRPVQAKLASTVASMVRE
jgi:hypothetical protein